MRAVELASQIRFGANMQTAKMKTMSAVIFTF